MLLDTRNRLMSVDKLYRGSLNSSMVRVGEVFKSAIRINAACILVLHNHPSGDPAPSPVIWRKSQGYWPNSATGTINSKRSITQEALHAGIIFPPVTRSRVLRFAPHPCGTATPPLTGARPAGSIPA